MELTTRYGPLEDRFWSKVKKTKSCWLWQAKTNTLYFKMDGEVANWSAHRVSMILIHGNEPTEFEQYLRQTCGNRLCVNPAHLKWVKGSHGNSMSLEERFWSRVKKTDGCWLWQGAKFGNGYGQMRFWEDGKRRTLKVHRYSKELHDGPPPEGKPLVCHTCDNPPCVNPAHLFYGSKKDNAQDAVLKGRTLRGENASNARFTNNQVLAMRIVYNSGLMRVSALSRHYGTSEGQMSNVLSGRSYKYVGGFC